MTEAWRESIAQSFEAQPRRWDTPGEMAADLEPATRQTSALDIIDAELVRLRDTPDARLAISMPPQEGKSQRATRWFPQWILMDNPDTRIAIAANGDALARRFGRIVRDDIGRHGRKIGLALRPDVYAQHEWEVAGHEGGVYAVGIGGSLTGRPVDLLIIDDPIKDPEQANSAAYRDKIWDWWTEVGAPRLAPGAPAVVIQTRWHEDDLIGRLTTAEDADRWRVVNIPAQADHRPERGETDILGRSPGEFMQSARKWSTEQWQAKKVAAGSRGWASLYQGRPSPEGGNVWHRDWWQFYEVPFWIQRVDGSMFVPAVEGGAVLIQSWDMAFKDTDGSDYVVGQVWFCDGHRAALLDQVRARLSFTETAKALVALSAKWPQAIAKLVEDKANGTAVLNALAKRVLGLIPEEPQGSKASRAAAVSPFIEAGNVLVPVPELAPWVGDFLEEAAIFPNGTNDDQVDAASQALNRLLLNPFINSAPISAEDLDDELAGYRISSF